MVIFTNAEAFLVTHEILNCRVALTQVRTWQPSCVQVYPRSLTGPVFVTEQCYHHGVLLFWSTSLTALNTEGRFSPWKSCEQMGPSYLQISTWRTSTTSGSTSLLPCAFDFVVHLRWYMLYPPLDLALPENSRKSSVLWEKTALFEEGLSGQLRSGVDERLREG